MRMFTITYDRSGRIATATVQGTEITTTDELLCICEHGVPLATFPKRSVLHVSSNGPGAGQPAPAVDDLGMPVRSRLGNSHAEHREEYWPRLRTALDPAPPHENAARPGRRGPTGGGGRGREGVAAAVGSGLGGSLRFGGRR